MPSWTLALHRTVRGITLRRNRAANEPINPEWLADFRLDAHSGLTSDIA
jgi:hypothetical protein